MTTKQTAQGHGPAVQRMHHSSSCWLCLTMGFALLQLCDALSAAEYKLIKGRQFELCRTLEQNLNSFKDQPPMVCERKFNPRFKDFSVPKWEPLDPKANMDLLEQIYKEKILIGWGVPRERVDTAWLHQAWEKRKPEVEQKIANRQLSLSKARFDLAHKGEQVTVLKLVDDGCDPVKQFAFVNQPDPTFHVFDENTGKVDPRYRDTVNFTADAFFYQGRIRLATWSGNPNLKGPELDVYETFWTLDEFGIKLHPVCTYRYLK